MAGQTPYLYIIGETSARSHGARRRRRRWVVQGTIQSVPPVRHSAHSARGIGWLPDLRSARLLLVGLLLLRSAQARLEKSGFGWGKCLHLCEARPFYDLMREMRDMMSTPLQPPAPPAQ